MTLVNTDPVGGREVLLQADSFGEQKFTWTQLENEKGEDQQIEVNSQHLKMSPDAAGQARLHMSLQRFAHQPSYAQPSYT